MRYNSELFYHVPEMAGFKNVPFFECLIPVESRRLNILLLQRKFWIKKQTENCAFLWLVIYSLIHHSLFSLPVAELVLEFERQSHRGSPESALKKQAEENNLAMRVPGIYWRLWLILWSPLQRGLQNIQTESCGACCLRGNVLSR